MSWENPFANFVNKAQSEFRKVQSDPEISIETHENRDFVFDVVDRVDVLSTAFERLRELSRLYRTFDIDWSLTATGAPTHYPEEQEQARDRCHQEAKALVTYAFYELSTLITLLAKWISLPEQSELKYLKEVRNKILTHPRPDWTKNSRSGLTIGAILIPHLVGRTGWFPRIRDWYLRELEERGVCLSDEAGELANYELILSRKQTKDFTPEEKLRLKAYLVREPDLLTAASEMAALLDQHFYPEVVRVCSPRVD